MPRPRNIVKAPSRPLVPSYRRPLLPHAKGTRIYGLFCELWAKGVPMASIANACGVTERCCYKWQRNLKQYGSIKRPGQVAIGRPYSMSLADEEALLTTLQSHGWMYQDEMQAWLLGDIGVK